jgi:hypothetical protein
MLSGKNNLLIQRAVPGWKMLNNSDHFCHLNKIITENKA